MKYVILQSPSFLHGHRSLAVALLVSCLGVATLSAQSSGAGSAGSSSGTTADRTGSSAGQSGTSGTSRGAGSGAGVSSSSDTRNANDLTRAGDTSSLKRADRKFITKAAESGQQEVAISQLAAQRATRPEVRSFAQELLSGHQRMNSELMQLAQRKGVKLESMGMGHMSSAGTSMSDASRNAGIATDHGAPRATGAAGTANTGASTGVTTNASTATSGSATSGSDASGMAAMSAEMASDRHYRRLAKASGEEFDHEYVDMLVDHHERDVKAFQKASQNAQDPEVRSFATTHLPTLQAHLDRANSLMKSAAE